MWSDGTTDAKMITWTIEKADQAISAKTASKSYKLNTVRSKKQTFSIGAKAKGKLSYAVSSTPSNAKKYISVSKKGKVTLKKGAPKGTYKITFTAKATSTYEKATKTVTIIAYNQRKVK